MKYLILFFLIVRLGFSMPLDGLSWGMEAEEVRKNYPAMTRTSFDDNEEVYSAEEIINSDTVTLTFLFYRNSLIQVTATNKFPRQNRSFSRSFLDKIDDEYTFTDIKTRYEKSQESVRQIREYTGVSEDGRSHLLLRIHVTDNRYKNIFIFTDNNFLE